MKENLKIKVEELLKLLDVLLLEDKFIAYHHIKKIYLEFLKSLNEKRIIEKKDFSIIQNCMRIFLEAPSGNYELETKILDKMQEIYDIEDSIEKNNVTK